MRFVSDNLWQHVVGVLATVYAFMNDDVPNSVLQGMGYLLWMATVGAVTSLMGIVVKWAWDRYALKRR